MKKKILLTIVLSIMIMTFGFDNIKALTPEDSAYVYTEQDVEYMFTRMPYPTSSYGAGNINKILNDFIPNELWKQYGEYYLCDLDYGGRTNDCYIFDDYSQISIEYSFHYMFTKITIEAPYTRYRYNEGSFAGTSVLQNNVQTSKALYLYMKENEGVALRSNVSARYVATGEMPPSYSVIELQNDDILSSLDFYIDSSMNLSNFFYELTYDGNSGAYYDGFKIYGLVNNSGLYHWEEVELTANLLDTSSEYNYSYSTDDGFVESNSYIISSLFNQYEKIKFSLELVNANSYEITLKVPSVITESDIVENFISSDYFLVENDTSENRYMLFSTPVNSLNQNVYLYLEDANLTNSNVLSDLFIDFFDTETREFFAYDYFSRYALRNNWYYFYSTIGLENKKAFYVLSNKNDSIIFKMLIPLNLYYSYNDNSGETSNDDYYYLDNSSFIDSNGDEVQDTIHISEDENPYSTGNDMIDFFVNVSSILFPRLNDIFKAFDSFKYDHVSDEPPVFEMDLSDLGMGLGKTKVVDFSFYSEYRETAFFWIELTCGSLTFLKFLRFIEGAFAPPVE